MISIRFEDHPKEPRGPFPPQNFTPMIQSNERVVSIETVKDIMGYVSARVWIERNE